MSGIVNCIFPAAGYDNLEALIIKTRCSRAGNGVAAIDDPPASPNGVGGSRTDYPLFGSRRFSLLSTSALSTSALSGGSAFAFSSSKRASSAAISSVSGYRRLRRRFDTRRYGANAQLQWIVEIEKRQPLQISPSPLARQALLGLPALNSPSEQVRSRQPQTPRETVCYMWWDEFPCLALAGDPDLPRLHETALRAMEQILGLKSLACQESALHGLGHWCGQYDREVAAIIDGFLKTNPDIDIRLKLYANAARRGCVL